MVLDIEVLQSCVHLVWGNSTIYFTYGKKERIITINKSAFQPIFQTEREIYKELMSHKSIGAKKGYTPVENLFPD